LQLLIENAIKHNAVSHESPLDISIRSENEFIVISNNIHKLAIEKNPENGISVKSLKDRYEIVSDIVPEFSATEKEYVVKIPIIKEE
jgi:LytS/YehU family sensor histidine kinase